MLVPHVPQQAGGGSPDNRRELPSNANPSRLGALISVLDALSQPLQSRSEIGGQGI